MASSSLAMLDVTSTPEYDDLLAGFKYVPHLPLASSTYGYNELIRFQVEDQSDFWLPGESFILIEGQIVKNPSTSAAVFVDNAALLAFTECKYLLNGIEVDQTKNLGISTTIKYLCSLTPDEIVSLNGAVIGDVQTANLTNDKGEFKICIPLRLILGFAEDYKNILIGARQELIFLRSVHDKNVFISNTANEASQFKINKMSWFIPSISVSDTARIPLMNILERDIPITVPFRTWEYHENPAVPQTTYFTWNITSSSQLERPRYVLFAFQTNKKDNYAANVSNFDHCGVINMKLYINSEAFPYANLNLDFPKMHGLAYKLFLDFQRSF